MTRSREAARRFSVLLAVLSFGALLLASGADAAKSCRGAAVEVKVEGRKVCSKAASLGVASGGGDTTAAALKTLLDESWTKPLRRFGFVGAAKRIKRIDPKAPRRIASGLSRLRGALTAAANTKSASLGLASISAAPKVTSASYDPATGRVQVSGEMDIGGGSTMEVTLTGGIDPSKAAGTDLELQTVHKKQGQETGRFGVGIKDLKRVERCPSAEGIVTGELTVGGSMNSSVTGEGSAAGSNTAVVKAKGFVGDDAVLRKLELEMTQKWAARGSGVAMKGTVHRRMTVDPQTGAISGETAADAKVTVSNDAAGGGNLSGAALAGLEKSLAEEELKSGSSSARSAASETLAAFKQSEQTWRTPNACVELGFTPNSSERKARKGDTGTVEARIQTKAGAAVPARWQVSPVKLAAAPTSGETAAGAAFGLSYTVQDYRDRDVVEADFTATSRAGIARKEWTLVPVPPVIYIRVLKIEYHAQHAYSTSGGVCTLSGDSEEEVTGGAYVPPYDKEDAQFHGPAEMQTVNLIFTTQLQRESTLHGCQLSPGNPPCSMGPNTDDFEWSIGMSVDLPSNGNAEVDWYLTWPTVGGPSFMPGSCFVQGASIPETSAEPASVSRHLFTHPGVHELSLKRTDGPDPAFNMTGFSEIDLVFQRVNEDGTPYHD